MRTRLLTGVLLLVWAVTAAGEEPSPSAAVAEGAANCWNHVAACVEYKTLSLPPTQVALSWDFPVLFVRRTLWDTAYMFTAPGRWDRGDWSRFSLLTGIAGGSFALDHQVDIESRARHPRSNTERDIENPLEDFGNYPAILGMIGGSLIGGIVFENEEAKTLAVDAGEAL